MSSSPCRSTLQRRILPCEHRPQSAKESASENLSKRCHARGAAAKGTANRRHQIRTVR